VVAATPVALAATGDGDPAANAPEPEPREEITDVATSPAAVMLPHDEPHTIEGRSEHKLGNAKSFREAVIKAGASSAESAEIVASLQKLVDFRRAKPEQTLVLERASDHSLRVFEYHASLTEVYRAKRGEGGKLRGEKVNVPIERKRIAKGTHISGSLGQSLATLGLGAALAGAVIEAFDAKISFKKDTRSGDAVKIIVDEEYVDGQFLRYSNVLAVEYAGEKAGKLQAFWFDDDKGGDFYDPSGRGMHGGWLRTPLRYDHISSGYNLRRKHPILKRIMPHQGIDYSAGTGTPVWAAAAGVVTFAGKRGPNGNLISLRHDNGYESHYAHLWRIAPGMKEGVRVKQRQVIGYVGTTGRSTGPHLHFALKRGGHFLDPATQLNGPGAPLPAAAMTRFKASVQRLRSELDRIPLETPAPILPSQRDKDDGDDSNAEEEIDL
jgi:murein DD-endopeptidase MepM/ murein hydrolase activator NlpD